MRKRVLIVEDDRSLCGAIARIAARWGDEVHQAHTVADALDLLELNPTLLIVDVRLPDGNALEVVETAAKRRPVPMMVAVSGEASPEESFRLAQSGVRAFLSKPLGGEELAAQVEKVLREAPELEPIVVSTVGRKAMRDVIAEVRTAMKDQALASAGGNRSEAARLLEVSRQAVQQMVREDRRETPPTSPQSRRDS